MKTNLFYAVPKAGAFRKAAELHLEEVSGAMPVMVKSFESGLIDGKRYLLAEKPVEEYLGCLPQRDGNSLHIFKSRDTIIKRTESGEEVEDGKEWIAIGAKTDRGRVLHVSENLAVILTKNGKSETYFKKALKRSEDAEILEMRKALEAYHEIEKGLKIPKARGAAASHRSFLQAMKGFTTQKAPKSPAAPVTPKPPKVNAGGVSFAGMNPQSQAQEGATKQFGTNDLRRLVKTANGQLRWMDADEYQKHMDEQAKQARANEKPAPPTQPEARKFRVGENIPHEGESVQVVGHSESLTAFKREDGTTGTFNTAEYNNEAAQREHERVPERITTENEFEEKRQRQRERIGDIRYSPHADATGDTYRKEAERIVEEIKATPEYEQFVAGMGELWKENDRNGFEFEKQATRELGDIKINGTMRRMYLPQQKDYVSTWNDRSLKLSVDGEEFELADIDGEEYTLKNANGERVVNQYELDDYRGTITLDDDGSAFISHKGNDLGAMARNDLVTQQELMDADTIKIINDEVYGNIKTGDGTKIENVMLGRIQTGIAFYKHGSELGVIDADKKSYIVKKKNTRRGVSKDKLSKKELELQKEVNRFQSAFQAGAPRRADVEIAKARGEHGGNPSQSTKRVDADEYKDLFDKFRSVGEFDDQLLESYRDPEAIAANTHTLAERMKAADAERRQEIEAFNALSKGGVLKAVPAERPIEDYIPVAADMLNNHRRNLLRTKTAERMAKNRDAIGGAFEWGETAEIPENAKALSNKVMKIRDSQNREYHVQYVIVPMKDVVNSHDVTGKKNENAPEELQARLREEQYSTGQMQKIAANINDDPFTDSADATRGAPIGFAKDGQVYVVAGHGRGGGIKATTGEQRAKHFDMLKQKAQELGLPTHNLDENDMLVRVMTPSHTYEEARRLASFSQDSPAIPMSEVEKARAFQNANREVLKFEGLNMSGIGNRAIDASNAATFISNNPQLYKQIIEQSGYTREAIESHPEIQSREINTALLGQLNKDFIRDVSKKDNRVHNLVSRIAPVLADNQRALAGEKLPDNADLQKFMSRVMKGYDSTDASTKALLTIKNGQSAFLNEDPNNTDASTLIHRMRQEDLLSTSGKEENRFRDPLQVIGLMAYHQAMNPRLDPNASEDQIGAKRNLAMQKFALGMKRYAEGLKTLSESTDDMFGAVQTPQEKKREEQERMIQIAERTLLEGKSFAGNEVLSEDEKAVASEGSAPINLYKAMKNMAKRYGIPLAHEKSGSIAKSIMRFIMPLQREHQRDKEEVRKSLVKIGDMKRRGATLLQLKENTPQRPRWTRVGSFDVPVLSIQEDSSWKKGNKENHKRCKDIVRRYVGKSVENNDTGWEIHFGSKGIRHTLFSAKNPFAFQSMGVLPNLVASAVLYASVPDKKKRPEIRAIHKFVVGLKIGREFYRVKIIVRESLDRKLFYDHQLVQIKSPLFSEQVHLHISDDAHTTLAGKTKIGNLLDDVKKSTETKSPLSSGQVHHHGNDAIVFGAGRTNSKNLFNDIKIQLEKSVQLSTFGDERAQEGTTRNIGGHLFQLKAKKTAGRPRWNKLGEATPAADRLAPAAEAEGIKQKELMGQDFVSVQLKKTGTLKIRGLKLKSPNDIANLCERLASSAQEKFIAIPVDKAQRPMALDVVTIGLMNSSLAHPREALRMAIELGAESIAFVHNHPSGNASPSSEDLNITKQLEEACEMAGIKFIDHVIVAAGKYSSIRSGEYGLPIEVPKKEGKERTIGQYDAIQMGRAKGDETILSPEIFIREIAKIVGDENGVYVSCHDTANSIAGVFKVAEKMEEAVDANSYKRQIMEKIVRNNAASAFIYIVADENADEYSGIRDIKPALKAIFSRAGVTLHDILVKRRGKDYFSAAEHGLMRSLRMIFNRILRKSLFDGKPLDPNARKIEHQHGEKKQLGDHALYFNKQHHRWMKEDEFKEFEAARAKKKGPINFGRLNKPKTLVQQHLFDKNIIEQSSVKAGDTIQHEGEKVAVVAAEKNVVTIQRRSGERFNVLRKMLKPFSKESELTENQIQDVITTFHPHTKEDASHAGNLIPQAVKKYVKAKQTLERYFDGEQWREDRQKIHSEFVDSRLAGVRENVPDGQREAIILAGGGGSGKSTVARELFGDIVKNHTHVWADADIAKESIPEYKILYAMQDKDGAGIVHEESSQMNKKVIAEALKRKQNLVIDGTLSDMKKAEKLWSDLKREGYKVTLVLVNADAKTALHRALKRFQHTFRLPDPKIMREANAGAPKSFWALAEKADFGDTVIAVHSGQERQVVYEKKMFQPHIYQKDLYNHIIQKGDAYEHRRTHERGATYHHASKTASRKAHEIAQYDIGRAAGELEGSGSARGRGARKSLFPEFRKARNSEGSKISTFTRFIGSLFRKSQQEPYGNTPAPTLGTPPPTDNTTPKAPKSGGISWKKLGQEKPNHKYMRREKNRNGQWEYIYKDATGKEFAGDEKGKALPRHRNWNEGDAIHVGDRDGRIYAKADNLIAVKHKDGSLSTHGLEEVEHYSERQKRLWKEHGDDKKFDDMVAEHEADAPEPSDKATLRAAYKRLMAGVKITSTVKDYGQRYTLQEIDGDKYFIGEKDGQVFQDGGEPLAQDTIMRLYGKEIQEHLEAESPEKNEPTDKVSTAAMEPTKEEPKQKAQPATGNAGIFNPEEGDIAKSLVNMFWKSNGRFDEVQHPRAPKGEKKGGQFVCARMTDEETIQEIKARKPMLIEMPVTLDSKRSRESYQATGTPTNKYDHRTIFLPNEIFGKIVRHKENELITALIPKLNPLLTNAIPIYDEPERNPEKHTNILRFHNYLDKVSIEGNVYYVRFSTQELITRKPMPDQLHNVRISSVELYEMKEADTVDSLRDYFSTVKDTCIGFITYDRKLHEYFIRVKFRKSMQTFSGYSIDFSMLKGAVKDLAIRIAEARESVELNPSEAQKKAGNYGKGHVTLQGLDIAIENPKGSYRSGVDSGGKTWRTRMQHDYGYFKRTDGRDGDPVDVFIGDGPESEIVFVIDQIDPKTRRFDEHKCLIGFTNEEEAVEGYRKNYTDNASQRIGGVAAFTMHDFKDWLENGDTKERVCKSQTAVDQHQEAK